MKRLRVLVFIEVDVVVRHFLDSHVFDHLAARHDVTFIFPEEGNKRLGNVDPGALQLAAPYERLPHHGERTRLWKQLFQIDQLRLRPGKQAAALRRLRWTTLGWKAASLYTLLGLPGIWQAFRARRLRQLGTMVNTQMEALFDREKPDVVVHPCVLEGLYLNDLVEIAGRRGIPLAVIMNSWDNPSTKRAMVGNPDWLLVWGEQTQSHAMELAGMARDRVIRFGAAQFEVYREPARLDRAAFCRLHGIDPTRRILLYAGSSKGTDEIAHLQMLEQAVERGDLGDAVILYRPHPWGRGGRGGDRLLDQPWRHVFIEHSMRGYLEGVKAGKTAKYLSDYRDTHDVLSNVDAVVSPLSTILLEAALHGKPILCFLPQEDASKHFRTDAAFMHFHDMFNMPEILLAVGYDSFLDKCRELLAMGDSPEAIERRKRAVDFFVEPFEAPYDQRLTEFLETVGEKR